MQRFFFLGLFAAMIAGCDPGEAVDPGTDVDAVDAVAAPEASTPDQAVDPVESTVETSKIIAGHTCGNDAPGFFAGSYATPPAHLPPPGYYVPEEEDEARFKDAPQDDANIELFEAEPRSPEAMRELHPEVSGIDPVDNPIAYARHKQRVLGEN